MYGDDLRVQEFIINLEGVKVALTLIDNEDDLLDLINALVAAGVHLLNSVCSLQKRIIQ